MTTLHPTRSRGFFSRIPVWAIVVVAALAGLLLIGAGLLLTGGNDDKPAASASTPTCTPTAAAVTPPANATITINVYNSTDRSGLAASAAESMKARDFNVDKVANDPSDATVKNAAVVRYVPGATTQARWVAAQVTGAKLVKVTANGRTGAKVDLVLGDEFDGLAAQPNAVAAFTASAPKPTC